MGQVLVLPVPRGRRGNADTVSDVATGPQGYSCVSQAGGTGRTVLGLLCREKFAL